MFIGEKIARFRKEKGLTQIQLGEKLGVSNQAVSKWELGITMPDIMLLPALADIFGIYIDELFSRVVKPDINYFHGMEYPWGDDEKIRAFICRGNKILHISDDDVKNVVFRLIGNTSEIMSEGNIIIEGNVAGDCTIRGNLSVSGSITGGCVTEGSIEVGTEILGECTARGNIIVGGNITGACCANKIIYNK